jgi:hypothetical protein
LENYWFWVFGGKIIFGNKSQNQRTAGSGHFKNLKELTVFVKERTNKELVVV